MANFRIILKGESIAVQTRRNMKLTLEEVTKAVTRGTQDAAQAILNKGRQDIASAGRFGSRWTDGLQAEVYPQSGYALQTKIIITHNIEYFDIFENGGTIFGQPLLWIPFSDTGLKVSASTYAATFGGLVYIQTTGGVPILLSRVTRKPTYFGKSSVTIPKKFHITEICEMIMQRFGDYYSAYIKG